jgi:hypothetical protein
MSPDKILDSELDQHDDSVPDVIPLLGASHLVTRLGVPIAFLWCSLLSRVDHRGRNVRRCQEFQDNVAFLGPTKSCHLLDTFLASRLDGASTKRVLLKLLFFGGDERRLRRRFIVVVQGCVVTRNSTFFDFRVNPTGGGKSGE